MEIRDPIHGSMEIIPPEEAVIDSPPYQRLRSIKQLGFSEFSFPGATHNRYLHSLGVSHLAGLAFDSIFRDYIFSKPETRWRLRQCVRLAALLHDIGHGPLSHTTEEVMPPVSELKIAAYQKHRVMQKAGADRRANHEDYTIKFITESSLTPVLRRNFQDIDPFHIVCLIDKSFICEDDFFVDQGINLRTVLSQLVSSEMDVDRIDYLERDAFFCGTSYGRIEREWLLQNLTFHIVQDQMHLALNRRALYTFDDFLISRHHMHLIVYFHHKSIIYEEMLMRYLASQDCRFFLPADIEEYILYTDSRLYEHLSQVANTWALRIHQRSPFRMLFEKHFNGSNDRVSEIQAALVQAEVETIHSSSHIRLSKYHGGGEVDRAYKIYVTDQYDRKAPATTLEEATEIFRRYEHTRIIERIYVAPEQYATAKDVLAKT